MHDQLTRSAKIARGMDAARLLKDDVFLSVIGELSQTFMDAWVNTTSDETTKREALWHHVTALFDIKRELGNRIEAGEFEQKQQQLDDAKATMKQGG